VAEGEEVVITRHGKAVARLIPNQPRIDTEQARAALQRMRNRGAALKSGAFDWEEWKTYRDEGRP
jgi:antitoxin (DNA-binding transcriptional repressor) of toxin-antitoxin stability system